MVGKRLNEHQSEFDSFFVEQALFISWSGCWFGQLPCGFNSGILMQRHALYCLVLSREGGMGYGDYWGLHRDYYRDPFPPSLLSTRQLSVARSGWWHCSHCREVLWSSRPPDLNSHQLLLGTQKAIPILSFAYVLFWGPILGFKVWISFWWASGIDGFLHQGRLWPDSVELLCLTIHVDQHCFFPRSQATLWMHWRRLVETAIATTSRPVSPKLAG